MEDREPTKIDEWMIKIQGIYEKRKLTDIFKNEKEPLHQILEKLYETLNQRFRLDEPLAVGGSGIAFIIHDRHSDLVRVLKFSRPLESDQSVSQSIKEEGDKLKALRHQNVIEIYEADVIEYAPGKNVGYTITEFVNGGDWESRIEELLISEKEIKKILNFVLTTLYGAVKGLLYVHETEYIHMDMKPGNVLISKIDDVAKIADLGFAKRLKDDPETSTVVGFTKQYAHPDLLGYKYTATSDNRFLLKLSKKTFRKEWDIYALGQSLLEILSKIDQKFPDEAKHKSLFRYLHLMSCRMLDGKNSSSTSRFFNELAAGLPVKAFIELKYSSLKQVQNDIEKELGIVTPDMIIPELNFYSRKTIHGAETRSTIFTPRLKELLEHPLVSRLARVSQLGLVKFLYPTASHSRLDHMLGTFTNACAYIDALYHDENPFFRQLVDWKDMEALMVTSLLHDLGQYPLAHDLEDVSTKFCHEEFSKTILNKTGKTDSKNRTIKALIESPDGWNIKIEQILDILRAAEISRTRTRKDLVEVSIRSKLLATILSGPIDADKTDYLMRDSRECRLNYGYAIDFERLMKTVTITYENTKDFELAVYDKGRACGESIALTRYLMFASAYWHHTSRSYKSMLQYSVKLILNSMDKNLEAVFFKEFEDFIIELRQKNWKKTRGSLENVVSNFGATNFMTESDYALLDFLYQRSPDSVAPLIRSLAARNLYKRLASLHHSIAPDPNYTEGDWDILQSVSSNWDILLKLSQNIQARILETVRSKSKQITSTSLNQEKLSQFEQLMSPNNLSIIVDVPPEKTADNPLRFVKETMETRYLDVQADSMSQLSEAWVGPMRSLFRSISVIRIFCHKDVRDTIRAIFPDSKDIIDLAISELNVIRKK